MKTTLSFIIILIGLGIAGYFFLNKKPQFKLDPEMTQTPVITASPAPITKLTIEILLQGTGPGVKTGDQLATLYTGTLTDGKIFDASSLHENKPFVFTLGAGQVIRGWDEGLVGMKKGEKRRILIPPELAYGDQSLIFEVELLDFRTP